MLFDTSAWIEFFLATEKGRKVKEFLKNNDVFTSVITLGELVNWCLKNDLRYEKFIEEIKLYSKILELDENIATMAGRLNYERKRSIKNWGMADSIVLGTSMIYDLNVLTTDNHFKGLPNAVII
ncbi:MAG: PIN domain-containing protein [Candidatus Nitrosotenuis sp.]